VFNKYLKIIFPELLILQNILEILNSNEEDLSQSFGQIAESAQHVVNTMVRVLKDAISKNPDSDADASRVGSIPF
jgi:hypothetical protein